MLVLPVKRRILETSLEYDIFQDFFLLFHNQFDESFTSQEFLNFHSRSRELINLPVTFYLTFLTHFLTSKNKLVA